VEGEQLQILAEVEVVVAIPATEAVMAEVVAPQIIFQVPVAPADILVMVAMAARVWVVQPLTAPPAQVEVVVAELVELAAVSCQVGRAVVLVYMVKDLMEQEELVAVQQAPEDLAVAPDIHMGKVKGMPTLPPIIQRPLFKWAVITEVVVPGVDKAVPNKLMLEEAARVQYELYGERAERSHQQTLVIYNV